MKMWIYLHLLHCMKSVRIRTKYTLQYSVRMRQNKDQQNSEYRHFSRSANDILNGQLHIFCSEISGLRVRIHKKG